MLSTTDQTIVYPDSDGKPMADNTKQFRLIVTIQGGLDALYQNNPNVFVAGDLLWYPVEGNPKIRVAPDVMVAFGRPKGDRGSYKQWEENNIAPQVVFEILTPGNTPMEMLRKTDFYATYGVQEYYVYDPEEAELSVYIRENGLLHMASPIHLPWKSPLLQCSFAVENGNLRMYHPDGATFETFIELAQRAETEHQRAGRLAARLREMGIDPEEVE